MSLIEEQKAKTKFQTIIAVIVVGITLLAGVTIIMLAGLLELKTVTRVLLIVLCFIIILVWVGVAIALEITCGAFECRKCGHRFVPTVGAYLMGMHTLTSRYLKCPKCGKRTWCSRKMSKESEEKDLH